MLDEMIQLLLDDAKERMDKALEHLRSELSGIRAGRATPAMLENIRVDYYGSSTPLDQMASVSAPQADLLVIPYPHCPKNAEETWQRRRKAEVKTAAFPSGTFAGI